MSATRATSCPTAARTSISRACRSGLGCVNGWGRLARPEYLLPYGDYSFNFLPRPVAGGR